MLQGKAVEIISKKCRRPSTFSFSYPSYYANDSNQSVHFKILFVMKILIILSSLVGLSIFFQSCMPEDVETSDCSDSGTLVLQNTSANTVQKILIDGTNYGILYPGDKQEIDLPVGKYEVYLKSTSGGRGCSPSYVTLQDCDRIGRQCDN